MAATSSTTPGTLYVVATPIGNRDDITLRALSTLKTVDTILAEDTRHSRQLLTALGIKNNFMSFHAHNEADKSLSIISELLQGKSFALISDAGTPLISDPGYPLVKLARSHHIPVVPVPGPSALITALSIAGIPCDVFTFVGFLPAKQHARRHKLTSWHAIEHTLVFYESTHRIIDCVEDIAHVFGESCELVVAKELTKTFERVISGSCTEVINWLLLESAHLKGEFVVIIPARSVEKTFEHDKLLSILLTELSLKQAVKLVSQFTGAHKNDVYKAALMLQENKRDD